MNCFCLGGLQLIFYHQKFEELFVIALKKNGFYLREKYRVQLSQFLLNDQCFIDTLHKGVVNPVFVLFPVFVCRVFARGFLSSYLLIHEKKKQKTACKYHQIVNNNSSNSLDCCFSFKIFLPLKFLIDLMLYGNR